MFKKEIRFISDLSVNKLNANNKLLTLHEVARSKIHPAITKYIIAYVEQQVFSDIQNLSRSSDLDYAGDKVSKYLKLISEEIKLSKKFSIQEITTIITKAVTFNINYLTRPNKTLVEFVFGKSRRKNISEITQKLQFTYYYRFLPKILLTYLTKKKIKAISKVEFLTLLRKIDILAKKNHLQGSINTAVNSMVNFFDCDSEVAEKVPIQAVELFLKEKGLKSYYKKLNKEFAINNSKILLGLVIKDTLSETNKKAESNTQQEVKLNKKVIDLQNEIQLTPKQESKNNRNLAEEDNIVTKDKIVKDNNTLYNISKSENKASNEVEIDTSKIVDAREKIEPIEEVVYESSKLNKPDARAAIKELVNIDRFYNTFNKKINPSENELLSTSISKNTNRTGSKIQIDYIIDPSNLDAEFNIPEDINSPEDTEFQSIYANNEEIENNTDVETQQFKLTEDRKKSVDEYINKAKEENLTKKTTEEKVVAEIKNENLEDSGITLTEEISEEMTEVFSDITYLEKEEIEDAFDEEEVKSITGKEIESANIDVQNEFDDVDLGILQDEDNTLNNDNEENITTEVLIETKTAITHQTFIQVTTNSDMSPIIETIFDYDMEDYQDMIASVERSKSESEAIQLVNNYCIKNSVNLAMLDVASFKSLITNYFAQEQA